MTAPPNAKKTVAPLAKPIEPNRLETKAMADASAGGLGTVLMFFDAVLRSIPTLLAPRPAYPAIISPGSGAELDPGPCAVDVTSNRFDLPHEVQLLDPDTLATIGSPTPVTFSGSNFGTSSVTIPAGGALDPPTVFMIEVMPNPGNPHRILVTRKGTLPPPELTVEIVPDVEPPFVVGTPVAFTANISGGVAPYSATWIFPAPNETKHGNPKSHTFDAQGSYSIEVFIHDSTAPEALSKYVKYGPFDVE